MTHKQFGAKYIIRAERGEELVAALKDFCRQHKITLGTISGLGAADKIILGLFKTKTKEYAPKELAGDYELTSVLGNISQMNGEVYLHLHATISDSDCRAFGGHLTSAIISGTFEGVIAKIDGQINRRFNEEVGLNLYDF